MCESKGSYPEHGQGGCPAPPILASSSTIRGCGQSTAHSWIRSWTGKDEIGHRHVTIYCTGRLYTSYDTYWTCNYKDNQQLPHPLILRPYWSPRVPSTHGSLTTNLRRWARPSTRNGWKTWNFLNTNKTRWKSSWRKSMNGGKTNLMMHPKPSREPVLLWALILANTKVQLLMTLSSRSWRWRYWCTPD